MNAPPKGYERVEIEYGRLGVEDFDFGFYNRTRFAGLETHLAYSYCNPMLQVLYFLPPVRQLMIFMSTLLGPDPTLAGELGFLFKMMDASRGHNCHAGNFLHLLGSLPQVTALGLHEPDNPTADTSYGPLIQNFNRFILEHLQLEMTRYLSIFPLLLRPAAPAVRPTLADHFEGLIRRQLAAANELHSSAPSSPPPTQDEERSRSPTRSPTLPFLNPQAAAGGALPGQGGLSPSSAAAASAAQAHPQGSSGEPRLSQAAMLAMTCGLSPIHQLFGLSLTTTDTCSQCKTRSVREAAPFAIDLVSAKKVKESRGPGQTEGGAGSVTFAQILEQSINREIHPKAWCAACQKAQYMTQRKAAQALPPLLSLNCGVVTEEDMSYWKVGRHLETYQVFEEEGRLSAEPKTPFSTWLPPWLDVRVTGPSGEDPAAAGGLTVEEIRDPAVALAREREIVEEERERRETAARKPLVAQGKVLDEGLVSRRVLYELVAVVAEVYHGSSTLSVGGGLHQPATAATAGGLQGAGSGPGPSTRAPPHLVAHVRVPDFYHDQVTRSPKGGRSPWYLFNDFSVAPIAEHKALYFHPAWKVPVILYYAAVELDDRADAAFLPSQLDLNILVFDDSIPRPPGFFPRPTKIPLMPNEVPRRGTLCALDAEFVSTREEETEIWADGTKKVLKPAQLTLARVSVVRGWGSHEGKPFIDDYIVAGEPIIDYLTKFSGINPGDLDPARSPHQLTTLKAAYSKLRLLCDLGCIFVGHGLRQDFRIISQSAYSYSFQSGFCLMFFFVVERYLGAARAGD